LKPIFLRKALTLLIIVSMLLTIIPMLSIPTSASNTDVTITNSMPASSIQDSIQNAINSVSSGDTITIKGVKNGENAKINLNIPHNIKVVWSAKSDDLSFSTDGGGTFEVVQFGSIQTSGKDCITVKTGNVIISGGEVIAHRTYADYGEWRSAIYVKDGNVTITGGKVSAFSNAAAVEIDRGNLFMSGGELSVTDVDVSQYGFAMDFCYTIRIYTYGTVAITGGQVIAQGTVSGGDYCAINFDGYGLAAYLSGTCIGNLDVFGYPLYGLIVEVDTLNILPAYHGTTTGLTQKSGGSISEAWWDTNSDPTTPWLHFEHNGYPSMLPWKEPEAHNEPHLYGNVILHTFGVGSNDGKRYETLSAAIADARVDSIKKFDLEIDGNILETDHVIINDEEVKIYSSGGFPCDFDFNKPSPASGWKFSLEGGGKLTLGDGKLDSPLTINYDIKVTNGDITIHDGIIITGVILMSGSNANGEITGGHFGGGDGALDMEKGARMREISGGAFSGMVQAVHLTDVGTGIDVISGGAFYQTDPDATLHGQAVFVQNNADIGLISGGYFEATRNSAMSLVRGAHVREISGGSFVATRVGTFSSDPAKDSRNSVIIIEGEWPFDNDDFLKDTTGIDLISGGTFQGAHFGLLVINYFHSEGAYVGEISGGTFMGTVAVQNDVNCDIFKITGGQIIGNQGMLNVGRISEIGGSAYILGKSSYGIFNYYGGSTAVGTIDKITGGQIISNTDYGIANAGYIKLISNGTIIGAYSAINCDGVNKGRLDVISNGVFWGKNSYAIRLAYPLELEPGLTAAMGSGRYWSGTGKIFNNEALVKYPEGYHMSNSSQTVPVSGITDVAFRFLTLDDNFGSVYNIYYDLNGGTNAATNPPAYSTANCPIPISDPARTGYVFLGWTIRYDNGTSILSPIRSYVIPEDTFGDVRLTALWLLDIRPHVKYSVTYFANWPDGKTGVGVAPMDSFSPYDSGSAVTVLYQGTLSMNGYVFLGWATDPAANTPTYVPDSTFTILADTELYAVWQPENEPLTVSYIVHYYLEDTTTLVINDKNVLGQTLGASATENAVTIPGYTMLAPTTVTITLEASDNVIIFYYRANTDIEYTVYYYLQGTTNSVANAKIVTGQTMGTSITEHAITISGYTAITPTTITATLNATNNVFIFYYTTNSGGNGGNNGGGGNGGSPNKPSPSTPPPSGTTPPPIGTTPPPSGTTPPPIETTPGSIPTNPVSAWALVNLILSIIGIISAVIVTIAVLLQRKQKQKTLPEQEQKKDSKGQYAAKQNQKDTKNTNNTEKTEKKQSKHRLFWLLISAILSIAGIIVFILTEDVTLPMVLVDKWTIVNAIILLAELIAIALTFRHTNKTETVPYAVHYYLQGTVTPIAPSRTKFGTVGYNITEQAPTIDAYTVMSDIVVSLTLDKDETKNTIVFYYKSDAKEATDKRQKSSNP